LKAKSALAIAPTRVRRENVKLGKGEFSRFARFLRFLRRFVGFLRSSGRFWTVDKVVSAFAES
jgi:hypothetical protein